MRLQPAPGGPLGGGRCHTGDEVAQEARPHDPVDAQFGEFLDKAEFTQGVQGEVLDTDRAALAELQGVDIDLLDVGGSRCCRCAGYGRSWGRTIGSRWCVGCISGDARGGGRILGQGRARDHLCHVALGGTLDVFWAGKRKQQSLRGQELGKIILI